MSSIGSHSSTIDDDDDDDDVDDLNRRISTMIHACSIGDLATLSSFLQQDEQSACRQDQSTGQSPLMAAAAAGYAPICTILLEHGAPWNAIDRCGQCAGNYATQNEHWDVVSMLVDHATRAELILGSVARWNRSELSHEPSTSLSLQQQPCTKPNYLKHSLTFTNDGNALLDADKDAIMMEWERPLMQAHAQVLMSEGRKTVLNVGFGMGIIDTYLQEYQPDLHIIIEAHPDVYQKMMTDKWKERPNVRIEFGTWQDVLPKLVKEGITMDAIFYDTFGEHFLDLEDFHAYLPKLLSNPNGMYSFFNGLAPDNIFFHGVACQCVKLQLQQLGFQTDFLPCEIQVKDEVWEGIRRKYWHGRDTYYLPTSRWIPTTNTTMEVDSNDNDDDNEEDIDPRKVKMEENEKMEAMNKRQRVDPIDVDVELVDQ